MVLFLLAWMGAVSAYAEMEGVSGGSELLVSQNQEIALRNAACANGEIGNCAIDNHETRAIQQKLKKNAYQIVEMFAASLKYKLEVTVLDLGKKMPDEAICYDILSMQKYAQKLCNYILGPDKAEKGGCGDPAYLNAVKQGVNPPYLPPFRSGLDDEEEGWDNRVRAVNEKTKELVQSIYCKPGNGLKVDKAGVAQALELIGDATNDIVNHATDVLKAVTHRDLLKTVKNR